MTDAAQPQRRMRLGGAVFLAGGLALLAVAAVLLREGIALGIDGPGLALLWLVATGAGTVGMGARMLATGRRPRRLLWAVAALIAIFVVAGLVVTLESGERVPVLLR